MSKYLHERNFHYLIHNKGVSVEKNITITYDYQKEHDMYGDLFNMDNFTILRTIKHITNGTDIADSLVCLMEEGEITGNMLLYFATIGIAHIIDNISPLY